MALVSIASSSGSELVVTGTLGEGDGSVVIDLKPDTKRSRPSI